MISSDKMVRLAQAGQVESAQVEPLRVSSSKEAIEYTQKFTRFPNAKSSSDSPIGRNEKLNSVTSNSKDNNLALAFLSKNNFF